MSSSESSATDLKISVAQVGSSESTASSTPPLPADAIEFKMPAPKAPGSLLSAPVGRSEFGGKKKVALAPGFSHIHWMKFMQTLTPQMPQRITMEEVKKHNKPDDMWMVIRGRVYDVTAYVPYHPGGLKELMKGAGKDATRQFNAAHSFVNLDTMMERCFIGVLAT